MTRRDTILAKGFIVFIFLLVLGIAITIYVKRPTSPPAKAAPIVFPAEPTTAVTDVHSSKADKKLILHTTARPDGTATYEFFIDTVPLFAKTLGAGASMALPFNAWDPTDTYVFLEEKTGPARQYYVFKANGDVFANGEKFIDVGSVWNTKKVGYSIREATGWASGTLLIIYTSKSDGSKGPAFWFEIPSTAIIQLAG